MRKLLCFLLLAVTVPAFSQTVKISRLTPTNAITVADQLVIDSVIAGTTNYVTYRTAISNLVSFLSTNFGLTLSGGTNITNINLQGYIISTPSSEYESPGHYLLIQSMGNQSVTTDSTGDGYVKFSSNLNGSNSCWLDMARGQIYASKSNIFAAKELLFGNTIHQITPKVWIGGSTGVLTQITVDANGSYITGTNFNGTTYGITNCGLAPQFHYSTNNGSTDVYTVFGSPVVQVLTTTGQFTNGNIRFLPFYSGAGGKVDSLAINCNGNVAAGRVWFGIYNTVSPTNLYPGSLIVDAGGGGGIATDATGSYITNLATPFHLNPGQYYWTAVRANTNITLKAVPNAGCMGIGYTSNFVAIVQQEAVSTGTNLPANAQNIWTNVLNLTTGFAPAVAGRFSGP